MLSLNPLEQTIDQLLEALRAQQALRDALRDMLITRAKLEDYTEALYAALVELAREGVDVLASMQVGIQSRGSVLYRGMI